ncbi:MAG: hypothetical protein OER88_11600, partial [Planctomycetota bacterium]|nr:hypothetical protein [Planctomycetota bacterium]
MTAYDLVLEKLRPGQELRTPDRSTGKPFTIDTVDAESVRVRTARGGRVTLSLFTFDTAMKYLADGGHRGESWLPVKDEMFQA